MSDNQPNQSNGSWPNDSLSDRQPQPISDSQSAPRVLSQSEAQQQFIAQHQPQQPQQMVQPNPMNSSMPQQPLSQGSINPYQTQYQNPTTTVSKRRSGLKASDLVKRAKDISVRFPWLKWALAVLLVFLVVHGGIQHYRYSPVDRNSTKLVRVVVPSGTTPQQTGVTLQKKKLIRSAAYFSKYAIRKGESGLQAGTFYISKSQSIPDMYKRFNDGPNPSDWEKQFIATRAPYAQKLARKYGVLASVNLAQGILESQWGQSKLATKYNNYYGIKAQGDQKRVKLQTQENYDGEWQTITDYFAVYKSWQDGMLAHTKFIVNGTDLNPNQFDDVMKAKNYKAQAKALQLNGYATDPNYAKSLIKVIQTYHLDQYD